MCLSPSPRRGFLQSRYDHLWNCVSANAIGLDVSTISADAEAHDVCAGVEFSETWRHSIPTDRCG